MKTVEIKKMSRMERLQMMEALSESFLEDEQEIEAPEWHREVLERRVKKIKEGKANYITLKELKANRDL